MPSKPSRIPKYRRHSSGQARVTLNGRDYLLGPYGSKESHQTYDRLIAEWLDGIAASVGVHPAHLARVFRQLHGCTVGDYVRSLRIEYACHCLRTSDTALATIALAAGFSVQSHFSRVFKRQTGLSPAVFRESVVSRKSNAKECSDRTRG